MDQNDARAIVTVMGFVAFIAIVLWAYSRRARPGFDEAARLPFADDDSEPGKGAEGSRR